MGQGLIEWEELPSRRVLLDRIERMAMSADAKAATARLVDFSMEVGGKLLQIGKAVLTFVFDLMKRFPNIVFGVTIALVVSFLIASVPLFGPALSALLTPLLVAFGLTMGAIIDMVSGALRKDVEAFSYKVKASVA